MLISAATRRNALRFLAIAFFAGIAALLYQRGRNMEWEQVWSAVQAYEALTLAVGLGFTALAYLAFGGYDLLARNRIGHGLGTLRVLAIALTSYALNLNLGALVGGWATRFRLYGRFGVGARTTMQIIGLGILSNWSGYLLTAGLVFSFAPLPLSAEAAPAASALRIAGAGLLVVLAAYLLLCRYGPDRRWRVGRLELRVPGLRFALAQLALSSVHWLAVCAVLKNLLPAELAFSTVLAVLLMSSIAGAAMHIPAGLGVLEVVFLAALGERVPAPQILAALLAYRATFYLVPLLLGLLCFAALEMGARGDRSAARAVPAQKTAQPARGTG